MIKTTIMKEVMIITLTMMMVTTAAIVLVPVTVVTMSNICTIESNLTL
jgi:hypothetical protein